MFVLMLIVLFLYMSLTSISKNGPELPAEAGLHQHVDVLPVLERLVEPENVKM